MIRIEYLEVQYGRNPPVLSIDALTIKAGERVAVIGPSGAGKSTLLRTIKGYVRPAQGKVEVMGVNFMTARRRDRRRINRRIGLVYQQFHLVRRLTVLQNVLCGRLGVTSRWRSWPGVFSAAARRIPWSSISAVCPRRAVPPRRHRLPCGPAHPADAPRLRVVPALRAHGAGRAAARRGFGASLVPFRRWTASPGVHRPSRTSPVQAPALGRRDIFRPAPVTHPRRDHGSCGIGPGSWHRPRW